MQSLRIFSEVYLHRDPVDMRKSIDGLSQIVLSDLDLSMNGERLFVFVSRCGRKLKMLYWDRNGFWLKTFFVGCDIYLQCLILKDFRPISRNSERLSIIKLAK